MTKKISILLGILASICTILFFLQNILLETIAKLSPMTLLVLLTLLILSLMVYVAYAFALKKQLSNNSKTDKINIDDYNQPKELFGVSKCKKTGKLYCTSCLINNIKSPVREEEYCWRCLLKSCNRPYWNQKYKDLNQNKSRVINSGMSIDDI